MMPFTTLQGEDCVLFVMYDKMIIWYKDISIEGAIARVDCSMF